MLYHMNNTFWNNVFWIICRCTFNIPSKNRIHSFYQKVISTGPVISTIDPSGDFWLVLFPALRVLGMNCVSSVKKLLPWMKLWTKASKALDKIKLMNMLTSKSKLATNYLRIMWTSQLSWMIVYLLRLYLKVPRPIRKTIVKGRT